MSMLWSLAEEIIVQENIGNKNFPSPVELWTDNNMEINELKFARLA